MIHAICCFASDYPQIKERNGELLSKISILSEIREKLCSTNGQLSSLKAELEQQYEQQKQTYLARNDVQARIRRIAEMMNTNFPTMLFEPIEPIANINLPIVVPEVVITSTTMKKKNRRLSMYDCEPSLIEMFDVSGYTFNPPSDNELSFTTSPQHLQKDGLTGRYSTLFDRNFGF